MPDETTLNPSIILAIGVIVGYVLGYVLGFASVVIVNFYDRKVK